jgi:aryl-alcohol dehydrogenase-like predicted oxidoreductase
VPYDQALAAVEALRPLVPTGWTMAQFALRWILMFDAVSCAIPGARTPAQATGNAAAGALPPIDAATLAAVRDIYDTHLRGLVPPRG